MTVNILDYLEEAMALYNIYSANRIDEILNACNHPHKALSKHKKYIEW